MQRLFLPMLLVLAAASSARAQGVPALNRSPRDTLRYREITTSSSTLMMGNTRIESGVRHNALIALTFARGDTALAWYEALSLSQTTPTGRQEPATDDALGKPFVLRLTPRSQATTLSSPSFPAAVEGIADLAQQFTDFFTTLPDDPLTPGRTWSDVVSVPGPLSAAPKRFVAVRSYRVRGDSLVGGERVVVIEARAQITLESTMEEAGRVQHMRADGEERGLVFFAPGTGRWAGRDRRGELQGTITGTGAPVEYTFRYSSVISPVARAAAPAASP